MAISAKAGAIVAARDGMVGIVRHVIGDQEIKLAVAIVIEPPGRGGPVPFVANAGFRSYVGESAVAIIVIEDAVAITGHINVRIAVIVIVAHRYAKEKCAVAADAGCCRNVGERAIAIIAVESRLRRGWRVEKGRVSAIN